MPGSMWDYRMNAKPILTRLAIATAPALFVLLWSTGFIGARYGMPYIEPLLSRRADGFRRGHHGCDCARKWYTLASCRKVGHSLIAGSLIDGLCLGGVFTAISQGVPAGISALIPADCSRS